MTELDEGMLDSFTISAVTLFIMLVHAFICFGSLKMLWKLLGAVIEPSFSSNCEVVLQSIPIPTASG